MGSTLLLLGKIGSGVWMLFEDPKRREPVSEQELFQFFSRSSVVGDFLREPLVWATKLFRGPSNHPVSEKQVERELILMLNQQASQARFRELATDFPALNAFTSPLELVTHLHGRAPNTKRVPTPDETVGVLIRAKSADSVRDVAQGLLILAFVPAIHRTYRQICVGFPSLLPEDVAPQVLALFLEVASSNAIERRNSHLPLTIARTLRTLAFRWAIKEARKSADSEPIDKLIPNISEPATDANFERALLLREFLQQCCRTGTISGPEYELLSKVKLEGFEVREVAGLDEGLSTAAIHRRLQRIIRRLRQAVLSDR